MRILLLVLVLLAGLVAGLVVVVYLVLRRFARSGFDHYGRPLGEWAPPETRGSEPPER